LPHIETARATEGNEDNEAPTKLRFLRSLLFQMALLAALISVLFEQFAVRFLPAIRLPGAP
jgi:hypothetical protein